MNYLKIVLKIRGLNDIFKLLYETNDKEKNSKLVSVINSGLKDLKDNIKEVSKEE